MPARTRNLALGIGGFIVVAAILWNLAPEPQPAPSHFDPEAEIASPAGAASESATPYDAYSSTSSSETMEAAGWKSYAIGLHELKGLAPDAAPGTRLEVWVSWESPVVDEPRVQRLLKRVVLEKIIAPLTEGPLVALLLVRPDEVGDLLYGHRYGQLSALVVR